MTIVSFAIIQLSPGDPLLNQSAAKSGGTGQSHEVYLVQKRSLGLDKPILLNFRNFKDYGPPAEAVAHYLGLIALSRRRAGPAGRSAERSGVAPAAKFLEHLKIPKFDARLAQDKEHAALAEDVLSHVQVWCEDQGAYAVPAMLALVKDPQSDLVTRRGSSAALNFMLVDPIRLHLFAPTPGGRNTRRVGELENLVAAGPGRFSARLRRAAHKSSIRC